MALHLCAFDTSAIGLVYGDDGMVGDLPYAAWGACLPGRADTMVLHKFMLVDARCTNVAAAFQDVDERAKKKAGGRLSARLWLCRAPGCDMQGWSTRAAVLPCICAACYPSQPLADRPCPPPTHTYARNAGMPKRLQVEHDNPLFLIQAGRPANHVARLHEADAGAPALQSLIPVLIHACSLLHHQQIHHSHLTCLIF